MQDRLVESRVGGVGNVSVQMASDVSYVEDYLRLESGGGLSVSWTDFGKIYCHPLISREAPEKDTPSDRELARFGAHLYLAGTEVAALDERLRRLHETCCV